MQSDAIQTTERERERERTQDIRVQWCNDAICYRRMKLEETCELAIARVSDFTAFFSFESNAVWSRIGGPFATLVRMGLLKEQEIPYLADRAQRLGGVYLCINISLELTVNWLTSPFHNFLCSCCLGVLPCLGLQLNLAGSKTKHLCGCFLVLQIACWPMQVWRQV